MVLVHYMPWYMAKPFSETWGWHWTMNAFNPENIQNHKREIASPLYPLIGPYDSADPAVLEYHLLLMKIAGIQGIIIDWYGRTDHLDYKILHNNTEKMVRMAKEFGILFAICYEDQTIPKLVEAGKVPVSGRVAHATSEIDWLQKTWFQEPNYLRHQGRPVLQSFGFDGLTDKEWDQVLKSQKNKPLYLGQHIQRMAADGAFDWPVPKEYPASLERFYQIAPSWKVFMPVAFPRFDDIYEKGKAQKSLGKIPDNQGKILRNTLDRAFASKAPFVQIATWNDWGEGTSIEPSREFMYRDLEILQNYRQESSRQSSKALSLPARLYFLRKNQAGNPELLQKLDFISEHLKKLQIQQAKKLLDDLTRQEAP